MFSTNSSGSKVHSEAGPCPERGHMVAPPLLKYEYEPNMKRYCQSYEYDLCWNLTKYMYSSILLI